MRAWSRTLFPSPFSRGPGIRRLARETKTNYNDDIITGWVGIGSQLDGLSHIGIDGVYINGREFVTASGLKKLGIETVPAIVARVGADTWGLEVVRITGAVQAMINPILPY